MFNLQICIKSPFGVGIAKTRVAGQEQASRAWVEGKGEGSRVRGTILEDFLVLFVPDIQVNESIIVKQLHSIY